MRIERVKSIRAAKSWFELIQHIAHEYQSYSVLAATEHSLFLQNLIKRPFGYMLNRCRMRERHEVYSVWDREELMMLAPLYRTRLGTWKIAGEHHNLDYQDFLYNPRVEIAKRRDAFNFLMSELAGRGVKEIEIGQLETESETWENTESYKRRERAESKSVCICLNEKSHEDYFSQLDKHARQNVRTAYNRLRRDKHIIEHRFFSVRGYGEDLRSEIGRRVLSDCRDVYRIRQECRYDHYRGLKHRFVLATCNYTTLSVPGETGFVSAVLIDGKVGAFMEGYLNDRKGALEVPRLAIDDGFGWYSPGLVLVNETAKFLYANTHLRRIDLCRGTEKYKIDMGGEVYVTKRITFSTEKKDD